MTAQQNFRVDSFLASLAVKAPVVVVTNTSIVLSGTQTVNGVPVVVSDRVLVKDQIDLKENGIWVVETSAWSRAGDFDGNRDVRNGTIVVVASTPLVGMYQLTATNPVEPGLTDLTFQLLSTVDLAGVLASTGTGEGASQVSIEDAAANFTATDVEAALAEIIADLAATTASNGASMVGIEDSAGDFTATDVEAALAELAAAAVNGTFSCTLAGFGTPPSPIPFSYSKNGNLVTITCEGTGYATSDNVGMTSDVCVPAALRPDSEKYGLFNVRDNGGDAVGLIRLLTAGSFVFYPDQTTGSSFTASGSKGIGKCTFSYNLNNS